MQFSLGLVCCSVHRREIYRRPLPTPAADHVHGQKGTYDAVGADSGRVGNLHPLSTLLSTGLLGRRQIHNL